MRHLADPDIGQPLSAGRWQAEHLRRARSGAPDSAGHAVEGNNQLSLAKTSTSFGIGFKATARRLGKSATSARSVLGQIQAEDPVS